MSLKAYYNNGTEKILTGGFDTYPATLYYNGGSNEIEVYYEGRKVAAFTVQVHPVIVASGQCGDNVTWEQTKGGTLNISGTGRMYDYTYDSSTGKCTTPWGTVNRAVIGEGVTYIGKNAFNIIL